MPKLLISLIIILVFSACSTPEKKTTEIIEEPPSIPVLNYSVNALSFEGPEAASAGWNTIILENNSAMVHFAMLTRYPEGKDVWDHKAVAAVFQNIMDNINGKEISVPDAGMELPAWTGETLPSGGPGLVTGGQTAAVTVFLEPGYYLMECYVKSDGLFHSFNPDPEKLGMVLGLMVSPDSVELRPPEATSSVILSSTTGFTFNGEIQAGKNVVEVQFEDQKVHEHFLWHDIHLAKLEDISDTTELAAWMNWSTPEGLQVPSPVTFVGGTQDLPAGESAYLHLTLEPGLYAWVAEVPDANGKNMLSVVSVE